MPAPVNSVPTSPESRARTRRSRYLQAVSLLWSLSFVPSPLHPLRHPVPGGWSLFAAFYLAFLGLYFAIPEKTGRSQIVLLIALFALAFVYVAFNPVAIGIFVYPVGLTALVTHQPRVFLPVLAAQIGGILVETHALRLPFGYAGSAIFFSVLIGLTNLLYFQEQHNSLLLERANLEIARLTREAERERMARDLHDVLGHTLTTIAVKLDLARRLLPAEPTRARAEVVEAEQTARQALAEVRETVSGFRSEGLVAELNRARRVLRAAGVELASELSAASVPELSPAETQAVTLAIREAITNIVRHAQASECRIRLTHSSSVLLLTIGDDGRPDPSAPEGNGIRGMRERLSALGGSLQREYPADGGTVLTLMVPTGGRR